MRMTITEIPIVSVDDMIMLTEMGDEHPHLECCRVERFFCGAAFHEELSAPRLGSPIEDVCLNCMGIFEQHACWRGHQHCPIPLLRGLVCPKD